MHGCKGQWIAAAASMLAVVTTAFALPVTNSASGDSLTVPPSSSPPSDGTERPTPEVAPNDAVWAIATPTANNVTSAIALPTEQPAVPAGTGVTPVGSTHNSIEKPATEVPLPPDGPAAMETTTGTLRSVGGGQSNSETLISQAMAALELLRQQLASQPPAASAPASINSINNIPVDSGGPQTIHNVTIGDGFTRFTPAIIKALPGETITFTWVGKNNHSVTESDQLGSCTKSVQPTAFDSGVQPPGTVWNLTLPANAKGLKFFYCKVAMHCAKTGMSGTIITPE